MIEKKKLFLLGIILFLFNEIYSQNDCSSATTVTPTTICSSIAWGTSSGVIAADQPTSCFIAGFPPIRDTWYKFQATGTSAYVEVNETAGGKDIGVIIRQGACSSTAYACGNSTTISANQTEKVTFATTPGTWYYIQIVNYDNTSTVSGNMCVLTAPAAQDNTHNDCVSPLQICLEPTQSFMSNSDGATEDVLTGQPNIGCYTAYGGDNRGGAERQSMWLEVTFATGGNWEFDLFPMLASDDIDFMVFGPFATTTPSCPMGAPIRCSFGFPSQPTGLKNGSGGTSSGATGSPYVDNISVTAGQTYLIMLTNFSQSGQAYAIDWKLSGGATFVTTLPTFTAVGPYCSGASISALPTTSNNGIPGTWSPAINNTATATYTFTPTPGICASTTSMTITVNANVTPVFTALGPYCKSATPAILGTTSTNGITGTWSPSAISTAASGTTTYTFTPTAGLCAVSTTMNITVNDPLLPNFSSVGPYCSGASIPALLTISTNGISGTWSPAINNTATTTYTFTPNAGQCGISTTMAITINTAPSAPIIGSITQPTCTVATGSVDFTGLPASGTWTITKIPGGSTTTGTGTTGTFSGLPTGTYNFTVSDGTCTSVASANVVINVNPKPTAPIIGAITQPSCITSTGSVALSGLPATGTWTVTVSPGGTTITGTGTTGTFSGLTAGATYTFTVTNSFPCTSISSTNAVINAVPSPPSAPIVGTITQPTCTVGTGSVVLSGMPIGATVTATPGGATTITNIFGNATFSGLSASTTYTFIVTNSGGCTSVASANVVLNTQPATPAPPTITAGGSLTFCAGDNVTLTSNNATGNTWSTGATTQFITVNAAGIYTVNVTNSNGCVSANASTTVTVNPLPNAPTVAASGPTTFCTGGSVALTSNNASGNTWSTGVFTQAITVNSSGTYTVSYTDGNACTSANASITVTVVSNPPTPTITASGPTTFCVGGNVTLTSSSASGNTWSTGATTASITVSTAGIYSVTVGAAGCSATSANTTVVTNPLPSTPTITSSGPTTFCTGGSVTLTSNNATGNTWSTGATTQFITVNAAGTYTVNVTNSNGCVSANASTTVTVNPLPNAPTVAASGPTTFCTGGSVTLTSNNASGNTWSTGVFTQAITVNSSGTYTVSYTDGNVCTSANASITVTVVSNPPTPTITASGPTNFCVGGNVTLTSSSASGNTWSTGATTASITVSIAGIYSVTVGAAGCSATSANTTAVINSLPSSPVITSSSGLTFCQGDSIVLNASPTTGIIWTPTNSTDSLLTVYAAGTYTLTFTDGNSCSSTDSIIITTIALPPTPVATANANGYCEGDSVLFSSNSLGATSYSWIGPNGFISASQNPFISNSNSTQSGTYSVFASSLGCNSVSANVAIVININPIATASSTTSAICSGDTINLFGTGGGTYSWTGPNSFTSIQQNPAIYSAAINNSGTYIVTVSSGNCSDTASVSVLINQIPTSPIAIGDTACLGETLILSANGSGILNWYSDAALTNLVQGNSNQYSPIVPNNTTNTYYVTSTFNGCISSVTSVDAMNYNVFAVASANPLSGFIPLNVQFTNQSIGVDVSDSFIWSTDNSTFSTSYNASYTFTNQGNNIITLIVIDNQSGCTDTTTLTIFSDGEITYAIPNIFTPNNDGNNDLFSITSHGLKEMNILIYDRWGLKLYEINGVHSGWDGRTTAGVEATVGTYYYLFYAIGENGKEFKEKGYFMLSR